MWWNNTGYNIMVETSSWSVSIYWRMRNLFYVNTCLKWRVDTRFLKQQSTAARIKPPRPPCLNTGLHSCHFYWRQLVISQRLSIFYIYFGSPTSQTGSQGFSPWPPWPDDKNVIFNVAARLCLTAGGIWLLSLSSCILNHLPSLSRCWFVPSLPHALQ